MQRPVTASSISDHHFSYVPLTTEQGATRRCQFYLTSKGQTKEIPEALREANVCNDVLQSGMAILGRKSSVGQIFRSAKSGLRCWQMEQSKGVKKGFFFEKITYTSGSMRQEPWQLIA